MEKTEDSPSNTRVRKEKQKGQMTNYEYIQKCDPETLRDIIEKIAYCNMEPWSDQLGDLCEVCPTVVITDEVVQGKQLALKECDFSNGKCPHGDPISWWLGQEQKEEQWERR